jgi:hypothetical protein
VVEASPNKDWGDYHPPCTIGYAERRKVVFFLETMPYIKSPIGYALGFKKYIVEDKLGAMKSHDYHVQT